MKPLGNSSQAPVDSPFAVSTAPASTQLEASSVTLPPSYQLISLPPHPETLGLQDDPQDYLLLINCQSKKPEPTRYMIHAIIYVWVQMCVSGRMHVRICAHVCVCVCIQKPLGFLNIETYTEPSQNKHCRFVL